VKIRILIADDHELIRDGLKHVLGKYAEFVVVAEASDGDQVLQLSLDLQPDVLLLNIHMPGQDTKSVLHELAANSYYGKVLMVTGVSDVHAVLVFLKRGAHGFYQKSDPSGCLVEAIWAVVNGETWISPCLRADLSRLSVTKSILSPMEMQVLNQLCQGLPNKKIADRLTISKRTVDTYVSSLLRKLGAANRVQAVILARENGLAGECELL
jgi:DNA-binding NarL/FixJ family response regulator